LAASPLLVFDFDGVLIDGMEEYWWAARRAALDLDPTLQLGEEVPPAFRHLRPLIHKGWEMVLVAAELGGADADAGGIAETASRAGAAACPDAPAPAGATSIADRYDSAVREALERRNWTPRTLQESLEAVRAAAIASDRPAWLARHHFYPGVIERLRTLRQEGADWLVLTTKGGAFAEALLHDVGLAPMAVYGHERGSKPEVLARLGEKGAALWFVEDRRPTLESVRGTPGLEAVRCFLAAWGYLAPGDGRGLPEGIAWLEAETFRSPLARWP
jgi:phosphoglycolate phosphatase-like HAD superfamily hydrolase